MTVFKEKKQIAKIKFNHLQKLETNLRSYLRILYTIALLNYSTFNITGRIN